MTCRVAGFLAAFVFLAQGQAMSFSGNQLQATLQDQARAYRVEGLRYQKEGNLEQASACYQKAISLNPNFVEAYNDLGILYEANGRLEKAKDMYLRAIEVAPNYPSSYANMALLYEGQGDYINAVLYWIKRATLGGPGDPWADKARKRLEGIASVYPEAYGKIESRYKANLQKEMIQASPAAAAAGYSDLDSDLYETGSQQEAPVTLFEDELSADQKSLDNRSRAITYLTRARESYNKGEYVTALKEATVAEYLDSSNKEISSFIEQVRRTLLQ